MYALTRTCRQAGYTNLFIRGLAMLKFFWTTLTGLVQGINKQAQTVNE